MKKNTILIFYSLFSQDQSYDWIPYGPMFLCALLKHHGFNPVLIHEFKDREYENIIKKYKDDLLAFGVSAMTGFQIQSGIRAVKKVKEIAGESIPVIWGGAHATAMPANTLKSEYVDYVHVGAASVNLVKFLKVLQDEKEVGRDEIPDLLPKDYFEKKENKNYCVKSYNLDLQNFPQFCFDDFDFHYLLTDNRVLSYTASIGCPGACAFCSWGGKHPWGSLKVERVIDDLEYLVNQYKLKTIWFSDAEITVRKDFFLPLAQGIIERGLNIYWRGNARVVDLKDYTKEEFYLLHRSGLDRFFIGVENINPEIQRAYRKGVKPEWVFNILENIKEFDIQIMTAFIFGNPCGPLNDLEENREFLTRCKAINPNTKFQVAFFTPYPGTPFSDFAITRGYQEPETLEEFGKHPYFLAVDRSYKALPWMKKEIAIDYVERFYKLFPTVDSAADWNWRDGRGSKMMRSRSQSTSGFGMASNVFNRIDR